MGYSAAYTANMTRVYNELRDRPGTMVEIVKGPDDLCACFPVDAEPHCHNDSVAKLDERVLGKLGFQTETALPWSEVITRIREAVEPEDIHTLCHTCQWRSYGVCEAGVRLIKQGEWLPPLPSSS
ncbi:DUF1284 domain-containing protein [Paenibacillus silvisoli]|uniref:DUF1284 domain-containing protein n=1 Tax=Paenibacillus silvisoli TaxID=3110539 RepID=UPI002805E79E|nr:DUF1284 domain-containing protein [Paenibacillus silvisoli]